MKISIDLNTMTLGELEFFEEESGLTIDDLAAGKSSSKAVIALITIQERRENPRFSMDDARKLPISDIEVSVADPTPPKPRAKPKTAS